jgi:hypothetical protein
MANNDLFQFFHAMNQGNLEFVDEMTDDEVKKISPYVLLMWRAKSETSRPIHTLSTAHVCSDKVFSLSKHPRLLLKLFVAANGGISNTRYEFVKQNKIHDPELKMIAAFYGVSLSDAEQYRDLLTKEETDQIVKLFENSEK